MSIIVEHEATEMLVRKLNYHEAILDKLLAGHALSSVRANFLERKMVRFEEMVLEIPEDGDPNNRELFDEWFDAVVQMWDRFLAAASMAAASSGDEHKQSIGPGGDVVQPTSTTTSNKKRAAKRVSSRVTNTATTISSSSVSSRSNLPATAPAHTSTASVSLVVKNVPKSPQPQRQQEQQPKSRRIKQTFRNMNFRRSETASATDKTEVSPVVVAEPVTKETISSQLEAAFDKLATVEKLSDLEAMQAMLTEVAKGVKHVSPFRDDTELQAELLGHVLPKLPEEVVERFETRAEEEQEKTLHLLKKCLINELTEYYNELKEAAADVSVDDDSNLENPKTCYYCKALGHLAYECPQAKTMLCYRCWKNGHKARDCGKRCHKCGRLGHYQKNCKSKLR